MLILSLIVRDERFNKTGNIIIKIQYNVDLRNWQKWERNFNFDTTARIKKIYKVKFSEL